MWPLPIIAMLGYAGTSCFAYTGGVFMIYLTREFGWSRTQFSTAFMLQTLLGFVILPLVGRAVDRFGPRAVALTGLAPAVLGYYLLSYANGSIGQWWLLCVGQGILAALISPTVWITAVAPRFVASRGLAVATVLTGTGVASASWPFLATRFIEYLGWRHAYPALAAIWALFLFPGVYFFLGRPPSGEPPLVQSTAPKAKYARRLTSRTFLTIAISGGLFSSVSFGMMLHIVPILQQHGFTLAGAAQLAVLAGAFSILGRMTIGILLDILPTKSLAVAVFLLPIAVSVLLWNLSGSIILASLAVAILGLAAGAETDVVVYILARRFEPDILGSIYSIIMAVFAGCASLGPLLAAALFDAYGSYQIYLITISLPVLVGAALMSTVDLESEATTNK
jgi:MFS family permease